MNICLNISGNFTIKELSLRCQEDEREERLLDKNKQIFPSGFFQLTRAPVKFTSIKDIKFVDGPEGRRIVLPDDFDGRIQIDVRSFISSFIKSLNFLHDLKETTDFRSHL